MLLPPDVDDPEDGAALLSARSGTCAAVCWTAAWTPSMLSELSMGMSHDFEVAVEEGATLVRVGTAIFGVRPLARSPGVSALGSDPGSEFLGISKGGGQTPPLSRQLPCR